jgi:hypothetical protein
MATHRRPSAAKSVFPSPTKNLESGIYNFQILLFCFLLPFVKHGRFFFHGHFAVTMTIITQLEDRGAAVAWSPITSHSDFIVLGAKVCFCCLSLKLRLVSRTAANGQKNPALSSLLAACRCILHEFLALNGDSNIVKSFVCDEIP